MSSPGDSRKPLSSRAPMPQRVLPPRLPQGRPQQIRGTPRCCWSLESRARPGFAATSPPTAWAQLRSTAARFEGRQYAPAPPVPLLARREPRRSSRRPSLIRNLSHAHIKLSNQILLFLYMHRHRGGVIAAVGERDLDLPCGRRGGTSRESHAGRLAGEHLDLAQAESAAEAEGLDHGLLGREAGREVTGGPGPGGRVLALALGEEPLGQARVPCQGTFQTIDLEQVDADAGHRRAGYFTPAISFAVAVSPLLVLPMPT